MEFIFDTYINTNIIGTVDFRQMNASAPFNPEWVAIQDDYCAYEQGHNKPNVVITGITQIS